MKNRIITGVAAIVAGLLIALGPQYMFRLCPQTADGHWMTCHYTGNAEIGVGLLIAVLGAALLLFSSPRTRLGLSLALALTGVLALLLPTVLIGGCMMETMACRRVTFPALTVLSSLVLAGFALNSFYLARRARREAPERVGMTNGGVIVPTVDKAPAADDTTDGGVIAPTVDGVQAVDGRTDGEVIVPTVDEAHAADGGATGQASGDEGGDAR
jgi:hypothetical protein